MPVELEDRIRDAGRQPRAEPDLEALWRSGRTARRRQIVSRGAAGIASVAVVAAVAVTQLPGDGVELADSPDADDTHEAPETGPPGEPPEGGHNPAVIPGESLAMDSTSGEVGVDVPGLPDGLAAQEPRAVLFPYTEVVAYQWAFGEADGPRLQALVYVGIDSDLDAALRDHEDSEEITLRGRRAVLYPGDEPAVAWQHEPSAVLAVHGMGGVTTDEVLAAAESLTVNRGDLRAAVASHSAQIRAFHREQDSHPDRPERNGDPVTFEGGSDDLRWTAVLTPATLGGLCWDVTSAMGSQSTCAPGPEDGDVLHVTSGMSNGIVGYESLVSADVAGVRYHFADGDADEGEIMDAGGDAKLALRLLERDGPQLLLVEALDADGEVIESQQPASPPDPDARVAGGILAIPPSPLPLSQFEAWAEFYDGLQAAKEAEQGR